MASFLNYYFFTKIFREIGKELVKDNLIIALALLKKLSIFFLFKHHLFNSPYSNIKSSSTLQAGIFGFDFDLIKKNYNRVCAIIKIKWEVFSFYLYFITPTRAAFMGMLSCFREYTICFYLGQYAVIFSTVIIGIFMHDSAKKPDKNFNLNNAIFTGLFLVFINIIFEYYKLDTYFMYFFYFFGDLPLYLGWGLGLGSGSESNFSKLITSIMELCKSTYKNFALLSNEIFKHRFPVPTFLNTIIILLFGSDAQLKKISIADILSLNKVTRIDKADDITEGFDEERQLIMRQMAQAALFAFESNTTPHENILSSNHTVSPDNPVTPNTTVTPTVTPNNTVTPTVTNNNPVTHDNNLAPNPSSIQNHNSYSSYLREGFNSIISLTNPGNYSIARSNAMRSRTNLPNTKSLEFTLPRIINSPNQTQLPLPPIDSQYQDCHLPPMRNQEPTLVTDPTRPPQNSTSVGNNYTSADNNFVSENMNTNTQAPNTQNTNTQNTNTQNMNTEPVTSLYLPHSNQTLQTTEATWIANPPKYPSSWRAFVVDDIFSTESVNFRGQTKEDRQIRINWAIEQLQTKYDENVQDLRNAGKRDFSAANCQLRNLGLEVRVRLAFDTNRGPLNACLAEYIKNNQGARDRITNGSTILGTINYLKNRPTR